MIVVGRCCVCLASNLVNGVYPYRAILEPGQFEIDVVDNSDGMIISGPIDVAVCAGPGTSEKVPENQGGTFYLQITARDDISWTIQIIG